MQRSSVEKARDLRRNQTPTEELLWSALRRAQLDGHRFRRQHPVGPYFTDFACLKRKLAVEIDGPSHDQTTEKDETRTMFLEGQGFHVMRFSNEDVNRNLEGVVETIRLALKSGKEV
jgi:very-short-patch-repair endonuclease